MNDFNIRLAKIGDADSIYKLFLEQFPFLKDDEDSTRKDVIYRITSENSVTVVAINEDKIIGVARGHEHEDVYLMNSICISPSIPLLFRSRVLFQLLPFFAKTCAAHGAKLGLTRAFFSTDVKSLARLVELLSHQKKIHASPGYHNGEDGFWISERKDI